MPYRYRRSPRAVLAPRARLARLRKHARPSPSGSRRRPHDGRAARWPHDGAVIRFRTMAARWRRCRSRDLLPRVPVYEGAHVATRKFLPGDHPAGIFGFQYARSPVPLPQTDPPVTDRAFSLGDFEEPVVRFVAVATASAIADATATVTTVWTDANRSPHDRQRCSRRVAPEGLDRLANDLVVPAPARRARHRLPFAV